MRALRRFSCSLLLLWGSAAAAACSDRPEFVPGAECELNSECDARLVCRLGRCRVECRAQRDCPAGLQCVRDGAGLGACQLEEEASCANNSDCPEPLVCQFGRCTNECNSDRDCPAGARCLEEDGERACLDMSESECTLNSDCPPLLVCAVDDRCREACRTDRDCRDGLRCRDDLYERPVCARDDALPDAGLDAAPPGRADGGADAGVDGGALDGGASDAGMTMGATQPWALLAAGLNHTCGRRSTGVTGCWGSNERAQIGDGTVTDAPRPAPLSLPGVERIGAGAQHSCAASATELWCWGDNAAGQAGPGPDPTPTPTRVPGLPAPITDLALGNDHTCAIADGRLFCWGGNAEGQLGQGDRASLASPTEVPLSGAPRQVSTFGQTTCARLDTGAVVCFGAGDFGQIGDGGGVDRLVPTPVAGLGDVAQIAAGTTFACALRVGGGVRCWGSDFFGQLGDGPPRTAGSDVPVDVTGLPAGVDQVAVGSAHACARTPSELWCWGDNTFAQLGVEPTTLALQAVDTPRRVTTLSGPLDAVGVGTNHSCVRGGADVWCFGNNFEGQLGNGGVGVSSEASPQRVQWP